MILQQAKVLSEMKKATWDLDSTDTFIKKNNNNHSCLLQQHFLVCMCVGGG